MLQRGIFQAQEGSIRHEVDRNFLRWRKQGLCFYFNPFSNLTGVADDNPLQVPGDLQAGSEKTRKILRDLEEHVGMKRLVGFVSGKRRSTPLSSCLG